MKDINEQDKIKLAINIAADLLLSSIGTDVIINNEISQDNIFKAVLEIEKLEKSFIKDLYKHKLSKCNCPFNGHIMECDNCDLNIN